MENIELKFDKLCYWINSNGGYVNPKLVIADGKYGRTIITKEKIQNEDIFTLPKRLVLNPENCGLNLENFTYRDLTVISLLKEYNKPNSFWKEYLNLLPSLSEFKDHPLLVEMKGEFPKVSEIITAKIESLHSEFISLFDKFTEVNGAQKIVENFTKGDLLWAFLCASTRMWTNIGLVPFADLLQHSNNSNMVLSDKDPNYFMHCDNLEYGQEVYDNYALNDDYSLYTNFGFVESSDISVAPINFMFEETILDSLKTSILSKKTFAPLNISSLGINQNLMRYIRINLLDVNDFKLIDIHSENIGDDIISFSNELRALKKIKHRANFLLSENETKFLQGNRESLSDVEKQIFDLLKKVSTLKVQINQFVNNYWMSFLGDINN